MLFHKAPVRKLLSFSFSFYVFDLDILSCETVPPESRCLEGMNRSLEAVNFGSPEVCAPEHWSFYGDLAGRGIAPHSFANMGVSSLVRQQRNPHSSQSWSVLLSSTLWRTRGCSKSRWTQGSMSSKDCAPQSKLGVHLK